MMVFKWRKWNKYNKYWFEMIKGRPKKCRKPKQHEFLRQSDAFWMDLFCFSFHEFKLERFCCKLKCTIRLIKMQEGTLSKMAAPQHSKESVYYPWLFLSLLEVDKVQQVGSGFALPQQRTDGLCRRVEPSAVAAFSPQQMGASCTFVLRDLQVLRTGTEAPWNPERFGYLWSI